MRGKLQLLGVVGFLAVCFGRVSKNVRRRDVSSSPESLQSFTTLYAPISNGDYDNEFTKIGCPNKWGWTEDQKACDFYPCSKGFDEGIWGSPHGNLEFEGRGGKRQVITMHNSCEYGLSDHISRFFATAGSAEHEMSFNDHKKLSCGGSTCVVYWWNYSLVVLTSPPSKAGLFIMWMNSLRASLVNAATLHAGAEIVIMDDLVVKSHEVDLLFDDISTNQGVHIRRLVFEGYPNGSKPVGHKIINVPYISAFHTVTEEQFDDIYAHPRKRGTIFFGGGVLRGTNSDYPGHVIRRVVVDGLIAQKKILDRHENPSDSSSNNGKDIIDGGREEEFVEVLRALPGVKLITGYHNADDASLRDKMQALYTVKLSHDFCFELPGDTPTRRSIYESVILGCIPVFFQKATMEEIAFVDTIPWAKFSVLEEMSDTFPLITTKEGQEANKSNRENMIRVLRLRQRLAAMPREEIDGMRAEMRKWVKYMQWGADGSGAFELAFG